MTSDGLRSIGVLEVEGRLRILRPATLRRPVDGQLDARCRQNVHSSCYCFFTMGRLLSNIRT